MLGKEQLESGMVSKQRAPNMSTKLNDDHGLLAVKTGCAERHLSRNSGHIGAGQHGIEQVLQRSRALGVLTKFAKQTTRNCSAASSVRVRAAFDVLALPLLCCSEQKLSKGGFLLKAVGQGDGGLKLSQLKVVVQKTSG